MKWLIPFLFLPMLSVAQQPFGYHATWYFEYNEAGFQGIDSLYHAKDTLYKGEYWQFFQRGAAGFTYMFQTKNDSVFYLLNDEKRLMYDYSAAIGDSWRFAEWDTSFSCVDTPMATVMDIGFDTINGNALKYWLVEDIMDSIPAYGNQYMCSSGYCVGGKIYEHIGRWNLPMHWFAPIVPEIGLCNGVVFKTSSVFTYSLRCYKDDNNFIQFSNKGCTWWSGPGVDENEKSTISIYPNPTLNGEIVIETDRSILSVEVCDLTGKIISTHNTQMIELPAIAGVYLVKVKFEEGDLIVEKIIRQ